jgi:DeoR/GlpR family transcriptional regulator of sugar metabolism
VLPAERYRRILASLADGGVAGTEELAAHLRVSKETVRRDLKTLEQQGQLVRVHGGATTRTQVAGAEPSYVDRAGHAVEAKRAIGRQAAALVRPGMTVVIDVGTTALEVVRALGEDYHGMVATCSLLAAVELAGRPGVDVIVSGGRLRSGDLALSSGLTADFFDDLNPDIAFLGSGGVDAAAGLTDFHLDEVATRRKMIARATTSYVLADSTKHGRVAAHRVCGLGEFTGLITDRRPDAALQAAFERSGGQLIVTA